MTDAELQNLRYPIGPFVVPSALTPEVISGCIATLGEFPGRLEREVAGLDDPQLDTTYRPGGWTIRQVVHHVADSHLNSYVRFRLALTEENPAIRPYFEDRWAELVDAKTMPVEISVQLLKGLHARWTTLLNSLSADQLKRTLIHPERTEAIVLDEYVAEYAWHCRHHLAHITTAKKTHGW
jgi:DinB superfamily